MHIRSANSRRAAGFTLLELVLVMFLAALVLAMVAPSLSPWARGQRVQDAADQFVAMTRLARTRAVSEGITYRINIDAPSGAYQLMSQANGQDFAAVQSSQGRAFTLPDGMRIELLSPDGTASQQPYVDFYPTGRIAAATVVITPDRGNPITIACPSPAEGFVIAQAAGGVR